MCFESCISRVLPDTFHAIPFALVVAAAHTRPFATSHPFLHDEMGSQIDAADLRSICIREGRETSPLVGGKPG